MSAKIHACTASAMHSTNDFGPSDTSGPADLAKELGGAIRRQYSTDRAQIRLSAVCEEHCQSVGFQPIKVT
eukprot:scaffold277677_cov18-Prasinocladus_malaysianus.AAC.1